MKWKFSEYEKSPEMASDLEWMLQSGQVSRKYFLEALAEAHYASILRMASSLLNDTHAAKEATRKTFIRAILNAHQYRSQTGVETWLFRLAYKTIRQIEQKEAIWKGIEKLFSLRGELTSPASDEPFSEAETALWNAVDELQNPLRHVLVLKYTNGWSNERIANVTGLNLVEVDRLLDQVLDELSRRRISPREELEAAISTSLQRRWPLQNPKPEEIHAYVQTIDSNAGQRHSMQRGVTTFKEMAIIGLAILIVFLMIWGGNRFFLRAEQGAGRKGSSTSGRQESSEQSRAMSEKQLSAVGTATPRPSGYSERQQPGLTSTPTPTPTGVFYYVQENDTLAGISSLTGSSPDELYIFNRIPDGAVLKPGQPLVIPGSLPEGQPLIATPVSPANRINPQVRPETSQDVFKLLNPEAFPFNTLWIDAVVISRQSGDPYSRETISRFQVWLSERQFLMIGGPEGEDPAEVGIGIGGRFYVANPGDGQYFFEDMTNTHERSPMSIPLFFGVMMLFGDSDETAYSEFSLLGESVVADREVWVVSQSSKDGNRQALLWLDKETGFSLHVQRLDAPNYQRSMGESRPSEVAVRAVAYDVDFPQELFNYSLPWRGGYASDYTGLPASSIENIASTSGYELLDRMERPALPENFDPSLGRLNFIYPVDSNALPHLSSTDLYAGGYYLGRMKMGVPWYASCQRSGDGEKIVFEVGSSGRADPTQRSGGFYYADLMSVSEVYRLQPAEPGENRDFAISPDNRTVAVWGCSGRDDSCGVYLHDMETHKWRLLAPSEEGANSFTWSPDGKSLAWMNAGTVLIVMDTETGNITYTSNGDASNPAPSEESPIKDWGVAFPPSNVGLEGCIFPPSG